MAKALLGYVGGSDPRLLAEMRRLQQRVQDLESELAVFRPRTTRLRLPLHDSLIEGIDVPQAEPALT